MTSPLTNVKFSFSTFEDSHFSKPGVVESALGIFTIHITEDVEMIEVSILLTVGRASWI